MIRKVLYKWGGKLPCRLIKINNNPYLERYFIGKIFGATFYLHRFVSADTERSVHDHPWGWAFALVLAGGYCEERVKHLDLKKGWHSESRSIGLGKINRIGGTIFHRIGNAAPETYTLFVHGPRTKGWGFLRFDIVGRFGRKPETVYFQNLNIGMSKSWDRSAPLGNVAGRAEFHDYKPGEL